MRNHNRHSQPLSIPFLAGQRSQSNTFRKEGNLERTWEKVLFRELSIEVRLPLTPLERDELSS